MSNGNPSSPVSSGAAPDASLVPPCRCFPVDPNTAMIFSDQAPLHGYQDSRMLPPTKENHFPNGSDPDFDAVWAHVPDSVKAGNLDNLCVLIYLHGFNGWVTVNDKHADGVRPHWASVALSPLRFFLDPHPSRVAKKKAQKLLAEGSLHEMDQKLDHDPIVLVPEDGVPRHDSNDKGEWDRFWSKTAIGKLKASNGIQFLVEDCFEHLGNLRNTFATPSAPYLPINQCGVAFQYIKRLFIAGHSGGGIPLPWAATSQVVKDSPTDLLLLDCTYNSKGDPANWRKYVEFCQAKGDKLGQGAGKSRMVVVYRAGTATQPHALHVRDALKQLGLSLPNRPTTIDPSKSAQDWPSTDMVELDFTSPTACLDNHNPDPTALLQTQEAMSRFKVTFVKTVIDHFDIPNVFIPLLMSSATVP